ncbi:hypothetical protein POM88_008459 [Heracleum sosnowskyi]|uniref:Poly [ADP-ribose] polymerase n=1 Tax=Heracleum sosnowskyi TaxID=360622 RepID=A0AAD8N7E1_9APIA|nr:hypothetical protein POM88_008459 [Heracleum sosnowskyi]
MARRYHRTEKSGHAEQVAKKARSEYGNEKGGKGKSNPDIAAAFERFCREISEYLSVEQMCQILESNGQQWKDSDQDAVVPKCLDMVYYGPLDNCPICGGNLECGRSEYYCTSAYSEWSTCTFTTRDPPRREEPLVLPDFIKETPVYNLLKEHQDPKSRSKREQFGPGDKPFTGMTISLCGRLSRTQQRWKSIIEEHGGEVTNSVPGITCLVVPPSESQRGRSSKVAEAMLMGMILDIIGLHQLGIAAAHCMLDPMVADFMKVCSHLMDMGMDAPDLPMGMLSDVHLQKCEETIQEFVEKIRAMKVEGQRAMAVWSDFSQRWFTLLHSTSPFIFKDFKDMANHAAAGFETVRDIIAASHLVENMRGSTIDDPLTECYKRLGSAIIPMDDDSEDYKMIMNYLGKTYEPVKVGNISYSVLVENIFAVEVSACPSMEEMKKLPNKVLLWCGTRSSNLMRHLNRGFFPAVCQIPDPGYMFGKAIVCSDAAAEAARYGFTAVHRPEGFLLLAVASLGEEIIEITTPPKETKSFEEKRLGVIGLGRKKTNESEHFVWKDDIRVPCGSLVPSEHKDSVLDYNEYAVYDPQQVSGEGEV